MARSKKIKIPDNRHIAVYLLINRRFHDKEKMLKSCAAFYAVCKGSSSKPLPDDYNPIFYIDIDKPGEARDKLVAEMKSGTINVLITYSIDMFIKLGVSSYELLSDFLKEQQMILLSVKECNDSRVMNAALYMLSIARMNAADMVGESFLLQFSSWAKEKGVDIPTEMIYDFLDEMETKGVKVYSDDEETWENSLL